MFRTDSNGLIQDIQVKQQRQLILKTFKDPKSSQELKELCLRVLLNVGLAQASATDLLLAAKLQLEHQIDITSDLESLCYENEQYVEFKPKEEDID